MSVGQSLLIDVAQNGMVSDASAMTNIVVSISAPLTGTLMLLDRDGNTILNQTAGASGAFPIAGNVNGIEYRLSSAADLGLVTVAFRPL